MSGYYKAREGQKTYAQKYRAAGKNRRKRLAEDIRTKEAFSEYYYTQDGASIEESDSFFTITKE